MDNRVGAIDTLCYLFTPEAVQRMFWDQPEFRKIIEWWGLQNKARGRTVEEFLALLDEAGVEKVCIPAVKMKAYRQHRMIWDISIEEVAAVVEQAPQRLVGLVGIDPFRGREGIREVERGVREFGFKGVYLHTYGFGLPLNDRLYYPFYETCLGLDIPVSMQVGHSAELMPSALGRPILIEDVALDFPELRIVGAHTGWPWVEEMIALAWKFEHVYVGIDAHMPKYLDPSLKNFIKSRGKGKVLWGTNYPSIYPGESLQQIREWDLKPEVEAALIRETAIKVFNL